MSKAISGLYESEGSKLIEERHKKLENNNFGLGPDDLISIGKVQSSLFHYSNTPNAYTHSLCGLPLDSQAQFSAYFYSLLGRQESARWFPGSSTFKIVKGSIYSWNSFSNKEVIITVTTSGNCTCTQKSFKDDSLTKDNISEEDWKQIMLSSKLRYYRAGQPLLFGLLSTNYINTPFYYVWYPPKLTRSEIEYCVNNHVSTDDLQLAITFALIINTDKDYIINFLAKYDSKLPKILLFIIRNISFNSNFAESLIPSIENHLQIFPDDLEVSCFYAFTLIANDKHEQCKKVFPLIMNSLWSTPLSSLVCSMYCFAIGNYQDCISFLNLSYLISNSPKLLEESDYLLQCTTPNNALSQNLSHYEHHIIMNPISGIKYMQAKFLFHIIKTIGTTAYVTLTQPFVKQRRAIKYTGEINLKSQLFFEPEDLNNEQFKGLYDPGLEMQCSFPTELKCLPISDEFSDMIEMTKTNFEDSKLLENRKIPLQALTKILLCALQCGNSELLQLIVSSLNEKCEMSAFNKLLLLKACAENLTGKLSKILNMKVCDMTEPEKNAINFMELFTVGIKNLEQKE